MLFNVSDVYDEKYKGKLLKNYDGPLYEVVGDILKGLSGKRLVGPSSTFRTVTILFIA